MLNQEKLINGNFQNENQSQFFSFTRPTENYPWNFKCDLDNLTNTPEKIERIGNDLINGINSFRRRENISEIKVVIEKFGYLTINN